MVATVVVTVFTANLALGVTVGVLLSGVFFTFKVARLLRIEVAPDQAAGQRIYRVSG
jgi:SulP family sulfate permease